MRFVRFNRAPFPFVKWAVSYISSIYKKIIKLQSDYHNFKKLTVKWILKLFNTAMTVLQS